MFRGFLGVCIILFACSQLIGSLDQLPARARRVRMARSHIRTTRCAGLLRLILNSDSVARNTDASAFPKCAADQRHTRRICIILSCVCSEL